MAHIIKQNDTAAIVNQAKSIYRHVEVMNKYKAAYDAYVAADAKVKALKQPYEQLELDGIDLFKVAPVTQVPCTAKRKDGTEYESYKTVIKMNPLGLNERGQFDLDILKQRLAEQGDGTVVNTTTTTTATAEPVSANPNEGTVAPTDVTSNVPAAEPVDTAASTVPTDVESNERLINTTEGVTTATAADVDPFESL